MTKLGQIFAILTISFMGLYWSVQPSLAYQPSMVTDHWSVNVDTLGTPRTSLVLKITLFIQKLLNSIVNARVSNGCAPFGVFL